MAKYDFRSPRLFVDAPLAAGRQIPLSREQSHYLRHVMRLGAGESVLLFNGRDGEWRAALTDAGKKATAAGVLEQSRAQPATTGPVYAFAPLKQARFDYLIQKAVELGASRLSPVLTRHTQVTRMNLERARANAIEAAEQCGILAIPEIDAPQNLERWLDALPENATLVFCDEDAENEAPLEALKRAPEGELFVLVGPEGGFAPDERERLLRRDRVVRLSLGPRVLRADTAAVAALALVQAARGDWR